MLHQQSVQHKYDVALCAGGGTVDVYIRREERLKYSYTFITSTYVKCLLKKLTLGKMVNEKIGNSIAIWVKKLNKN